MGDFADMIYDQFYGGYDECESPYSPNNRSDNCSWYRAREQPFRTKFKDIIGQDVYCPNCSAKMVIRKNSKNGNEFFGCSNFPKCRKSIS